MQSQLDVSLNLLYLVSFVLELAAAAAAEVEDDDDDDEICRQKPRYEIWQVCCRLCKVWKFTHR